MDFVCLSNIIRQKTGSLYELVYSKQIVRQKAVGLQKMEDIIDLLSEIEDGSIFVESHRIMTADQVLKTGRGNSVAKALWLPLFLTLLWNIQPLYFLPYRKPTV